MYPEVGAKCSCLPSKVRVREVRRAGCRAVKENAERGGVIVRMTWPDREYEALWTEVSGIGGQMKKG